MPALVITGGGYSNFVNANNKNILGVGVAAIAPGSRSTLQCFLYSAIKNNPQQILSTTANK